MERLPDERSAARTSAVRPGAVDGEASLALLGSAGNAAVARLMGPPGGTDQHGTSRADAPPGDAGGSVQRALARTVRHRNETAQHDGGETVGAADAQRLYRSPALELRALLRGSAGGLARAQLARAVKTSGGEWDAPKYDLKENIDGAGAAVPAAQGMRGVDITVQFKPNDQVDAELIGLTQTVQAVVGGAPNLTPGAALRPIAKGDAKPINTGPGETDEGTAIDQSTTNTNPIYAVESDKSASLSDAADAQFGDNGFHFKDKTGAVKHKDAKLMDTPRRAGAQKDSRHVFETTALATKGTQAGTYYGSVRWGWRTDSAGKFDKIPLEKVTDGVPSSTFLKAAQVWNASKTAGGKDTVDLPVPDVKVTTAPVTLHPPPTLPQPAVDLPVGTRLSEDPTGAAAGAFQVIDGPHTGLTGIVAPGDLGKISDERA